MLKEVLQGILLDYVDKTLTKEDVHNIVGRITVMVQTLQNVSQKEGRETKKEPEVKKDPEQTVTTQTVNTEKGNKAVVATPSVPTKPKQTTVKSVLSYPRGPGIRDGKMTDGDIGTHVVG